MTASASTPVLRELLDEARGKNYGYGVIGVRAKPDWPPDTRTFTHDKMPVRIEPCVSALAVREALLSRRKDEWLIVLTDRSDEDLGAGVLSHFVGHRLRTPDPWAAVRNRFEATGIDPAIFATAGDRDVATGLLAATPPDGWPPAPGGVLTRAHAFGAVAAAHLGLSDPVVDIAAVLGWAASPPLPERISDLRMLAGDPVTDAVLAWAAERTGTIARAVLHLLRGGEARDVIPLGLVAGVLADARDNRTAEDAQVARDALIRMEARFGGAVLSSAALTSWAAEASAVVTGMLRVTVRRAPGEGTDAKAAGEALLARADHLLGGVRAAGLADGSDLLPSGLTRRFAALAAELRAATGGRAEPTPTRRSSRGTRSTGSSGPGPASRPIISPGTTAGRTRSTPPSGSPAGSRTPHRTARGCPGCCAGTPTRTRGRTRRSTTSPPGPATRKWAPAWPPSWPPRGPGGPRTTPASPPLWPATPGTTAATRACCTSRTCSAAWSCRWPRRPRCCCSYWTG